MALTEIPSELSSTPSIEDNGNATAITIGSDESATFSGSINLTAGALAAAGNAGLSHRSADNKVYLQAGTGGFNILDDQQNTHLSIDSSGKVDIGGVGNITPYGIRFAINGTGTGGSGLYFGSSVILPTNNTPTISDGAVDIGQYNYRFKNIHLSGGVNFGDATGGITYTNGNAANTLDDYEEGTWTPTLVGYYGNLGTTFTQGTRNGVYTKIGNLVTLGMEINNAGVAAANNNDIVAISGLPFNIGGYGIVGAHVHTSAASKAGGGWTSISSTKLGHLGNSGVATSVWAWLRGSSFSTSGVAIRLTVTYRVA